MENLSFVITGRNDNYDGNFDERLIVALAKNIAALPQAEFIFVEWNPIPNRPLTCENIRKIFGDRIRYYVGHPDFHNHYCTIDGFLEYPPKNIGIRKASESFVACMNSDIIFCPDLIENLKGPLNKDVIYRANRVDIKLEYLDVNFPLDSQYILQIHEGVTNASGDFLMMSKDMWTNSTGYMEILPQQRLHKDSEILWRLRNSPVQFLGHMTHWRHPSSWATSFNRPRVGDPNWNFKTDFTRNADNWGLSHAIEEDRDGIIWLVPQETPQTENKPMKRVNSKNHGKFFPNIFKKETL